MSAGGPGRTRRLLGGVAALLAVATFAVTLGPLQGLAASRTGMPSVGFVATETGPDGVQRPATRDARPSRDPARTLTVSLDPSRRAQTWIGLGGALTDASATLLDAVPAGVDRLFGSPDLGGAGLDIVRLPLSATDFSVEDWTWTLERTGHVTPPAPALDAVAVLDEIEAVRPDLAVLAAPWTSPATMRTGRDARGGALLDAAVDDYARLLLGQATWLRRHGVPLVGVSVGNEPGHLGEYPTLSITDEQAVGVADLVEDELDRLDVELIALDHNWSDVDRARELLGSGAFDRVGFHCYDGEARQASAVAAPHLVTECTATDGDWHASVGWMARELVGDAVASGSTGLVMWNLALDPEHGPKAPGGCGDCRGLVTIDPVTGSVAATPEFDVVRALSAAADPGASVVTVDRIDGFPIAAFVNPDGSIGVFGHNDSPTPVELHVDIAGAGTMQLAIDGWSIVSLRTTVG